MKNNTITSKEISDKLKIPHEHIMQYYSMLESLIVFRRDLIECTLVIESRSKNNWLKDISPGLEMAIYIHFEKQYEIDRTINN